MIRTSLVRSSLSLLGLLGVFLVASLLLQSVARAQPKATLYVGGYTREAGDGLCALSFDPKTGTLSELRVAAPLKNPDWIERSPDGRTLYAAGTREAGNGVTSFAIEKDGALRETSRQSDPDRPVSLAVDATQKWLIGAYYGGSNWAIWPLNGDGTIGARKELVQHEGSGPNAGRQEKPHPHQAVVAPDNRRIWIVDLGTDQAMIYDFDAQTGAVKPSQPAYAAATPGSGPRHLAFGRKGQVVYVVNELSSTVTVFQGGRGRPGAIQTLSTLPADYKGKSTGAEVVVSPDGRFVFASNRGYNSIARFAVARDGALQLLGWTPVGKEPRHFTFDPSGKWVLVGNQIERSVSVYAYDKATGDLSFSSKFEGIKNQPTCLVFG